MADENKTPMQEFLERYGFVLAGEGLKRNFEGNSKTPGIDEKIIDFYQKVTQRKIDLTKPTGGVERLNDRELMAYLDSAVAVAVAQAKDHADKNLEAILGEAGEDNLRASFLDLPPKKVETDVEKAHVVYFNSTNLAANYERAKEPKDMKKAFGAVMEFLPAAEVEYLKSKGIKEEHAIVLARSSVYVARGHEGVAIATLRDLAKMKAEEVNKQLEGKGKLVSYVQGNLDGAEDEAKWQFYRKLAESYVKED